MSCQHVKKCVHFKQSYPYGNLLHNDFGNYVLEWCIGRIKGEGKYAVYGKACPYHRKLYGKEKEKWQKILARGAD